MFCIRITVAHALLLVSAVAHTVPTLAVEERQTGTLVGTTVALDYATFTGLKSTDTGITYFRGLAYADPPVGNLRWRLPVVPPTAKLGNVDASKFANTCIQAGQTSVPAGYSEDCLYGNVYVPANTRTDSKLPVMVWFHGGGWQGGDSHATPDYLMKDSLKPMIMVSFAYRLGHFGFLGGSQIQADGTLNVGLHDQRGALRWVHKYISQFGGDNSKTTIWGESAGGGAVMFHLIANGGNNEALFRGAMADSPSLSFVPTYNDAYVEGIYTQLADFAGCGNKGSATLQCLRALTSSDIAAAGSQLLAARPSTIYVFGPMLDGSAFLSKRPNDAFASGAFAKVPVLLGYNTNEGAGWSTLSKDPAANTDTAGADQTTVFNFFKGQYDTIQRSSFDTAVSTLYPPATYGGSMTRLAQQMYGEERYMCTAGLVVGAARKAGIVDAYQYHYNNPHLTSNHGSELDAMFSMPANANADDIGMFTAMREHWTSFVIGGKPISTNNVLWTAVRDSTASPEILLQPGNIKMEEVDLKFLTRCNFWHKLGPQMQT